MDIANYYSNYLKTKTEKRITEKQISFIKSLIKNLDLNKDEFSIINELLEKNVKKWEDLSYQDVKILISKLKNRQPLSYNELKAIREYNLQEINTRFNTKFMSYDSLNKWHYKQLFPNPNKFNLRSIDYPIEANIDYEYGYQESPLCENNQMYYLKFYELMMLDYDSIEWEDLIKILNPYQNFLFKIYKTYNGFHVFILSHRFLYADLISYNFMKQMKCDPYYALFCHKNGYKIRLSKKNNRNEETISEFLSFYGNGKIDKNLNELIKIHDSFFKY